RALTGEDDRVGVPPVAVISHGLWLRRFGGDSTIIGKALPIFTNSYTIVGVVPGDFDFPAGAEAWVTLSAVNPAVVSEEPYGTLDLVGRLRPGYNQADAQAELGRLIPEAEASAWAKDSRLVAVVQSLPDVLVGQVRPALLVLWSAALLVFLVAVLNLGSLLVVRNLERQQEFTVRRALGATRLTLIRQVTIESAMVVALGAILGLGFAWAALHLVPTIAPADLPRIGDIALRPGVIVVGLGLGLAGVAIASALSALSIRGLHFTSPRGVVGRSSERSRISAGTVAVAAQVALAIVTVATALLLVRTLTHLHRLQPGFDAADLAVVQVAFLSSKFETTEQVVPLLESVLDRTTALPGVQSATVALNPPLSGTGGYDFGFVAEGQTEAEAAANPYLNYEVVTPGYFTTLRTPILRGRGLTDADRATTLPVVVVSRSLAERMWPGENPIGKRIRWGADSTPANAWRTIVGIASDTRYRELLQLRPSVYVPIGQQQFSPSFLVVRSNLPPGVLLSALRRTVRAVDPDLDVANASSMAALLSRPLAQPRFNAGVLFGFAVVAVLLAAIGLYGLVSFLVAQRTREVGIRIAVGAQPREILTLFLRRGLVPVVAGCAAGVVAVLAGAQFVSSMLYGVTARDPVAIVGAVLGFTLVALTAILVPARRAAESDPGAALRLE
ncbi:MAG: FtsX-like permease family protein, partial [Gemmatimonadales bacterium]